MQLTNSTSWASASLEGFKTRCLNELKQNNTLQEEKDNTTSIAKRIMILLCKNECSGHGNCVNGNPLNHLYTCTLEFEFKVPSRCIRIGRFNYNLGYNLNING